MGIPRDTMRPEELRQQLSSLQTCEVRSSLENQPCLCTAWSWEKSNCRCVSSPASIAHSKTPALSSDTSEIECSRAQLGPIKLQATGGLTAALASHYLALEEKSHLREDGALIRESR